MNKQKTNLYLSRLWFTIVELIVTIALVIILAVVWFYAYTSYLVWVRDSARLVDLESIESAIGSYMFRSWFYPDPSEWQDVTYSWKTVWTQWTIWESLFDILQLNDDVVDPKTGSEYTYSIKNTRKEFSIAATMEESPWLVSWLTPETYAAEPWTQVGYAVVQWNYNGEVVSVKLNFKNYILALPSIISSNLDSLDLMDILNNNYLVYHEYENLPASYKWSIFNLNGNHDFSPNDLIVYSWSVADLKQPYYQVKLLQNVYNSYSGSLLGNKIITNRIDGSDLFSAEPTSQVKTMACDLINFRVKYFVECAWIDFITFFVINVLRIDITQLPWNQITAVYQDADGNFVFGTNHGLSFYDGTNWITYTKQNSDLVRNFITSVVQDNNGHYWIGTDNGISKLEAGVLMDPNDDVWVTFDKDILFKSHIQYIYTDSYWVVWIGTNQWVTTYNWDIWTDYTEKTSWLTHDNITAIYNDSQWFVWFGTNSQWVDKYELSTWNVTNYNVWALPDHRVTYIFESSTWDIWVGTEWWIWVTTDSWATWTTYTNSSTSGWLTDDVITYIFESTAWDIWFGTKDGLSVFDGSSWDNYSTTHPSDHQLLGDNIYLVYEDEIQSIIVFTDGWNNTINSLWNVIP